ncbi:uncharacterized protein DS421_2g57330 [Arachis hypogaea]|nr:uncharacterized protein DS421_2g57330 [Arachis hypogaea]
MTTNAAPKFLLCILLVAALFTSGAKSETTDRTAIMDCDENTKHCDSQDCSNFCTVTKHFQAGQCNPKRGCCCYSNNRLT